MSTDQKPWYRRLTPEQFAWLFPKGESSVDEFLATVAEGEEHGIPAKCEDPETLLRIARIFTG